MVKNTSALSIGFFMAMAIGIASIANAATLVKQFVSTPTTDSSTLKETVQGCNATSIDYAKLGQYTIANLYDDGSFELGYSTKVDDHLDEAGIVLRGIWSTIDTKNTKFEFQPDGDLAIGNSHDGYGTLGWMYLYNWTLENGCKDQTIKYKLTYPATFRILKSDMTLTTSNNAGTLRLTLQGYGQTSASLTTPPQTAPLMKYDMQVKGFWHFP